jgi:hypothetical protein
MRRKKNTSCGLAGAVHGHMVAAATNYGSTLADCCAVDEQREKNKNK